MLIVRGEVAQDAAAIRRVNEQAFGRPAEADLVDALRRRGSLTLGPMAVTPARQRQGIGSLLVTKGLAECRAAGWTSVVALGHPESYPRFGFAPARTLGITCEYPVPDEVFMAMELVPGALAGRAGVVRYQAEFTAV